MVPSHGSSNSGCARAKSRRRMISVCCSSVNSCESSFPSNSRRFSSNHIASRCRSRGVNSRIALSSCSKLTMSKSSVSDSRLQRPAAVDPRGASEYFGVQFAERHECAWRTNQRQSFRIFLPRAAVVNWKPTRRTCRDNPHLASRLRQFPSSLAITPST